MICERLKNRFLYGNLGIKIESFHSAIASRVSRHMESKDQNKNTVIKIMIMEIKK